MKEISYSGFIICILDLRITQTHLFIKKKENNYRERIEERALVKKFQLTFLERIV